MSAELKECSCGGEFLRHGKTYYGDTSIVGVRYICRDCRKSKTVRFQSDEVNGSLFLNSNGRPFMNDWRYA